MLMLDANTPDNLLIFSYDHHKAVPNPIQHRSVVQVIEKSAVKTEYVSTAVSEPPIRPFRYSRHLLEGRLAGAVTLVLGLRHDLSETASYFLLSPCAVVAEVAESGCVLDCKTLQHQQWLYVVVVRNPYGRPSLSVASVAGRRHGKELVMKLRMSCL